MISFLTFGTFVCFFTYYTPTQGNLEVVEASFENGQSFSTSRNSRRYAYLFCSSWKTYEIEQTEYVNDELEAFSVQFKIEGIDTVMGVDLVLRTGDNSYLQLELTSPRMSKVLFTATTRPKLGDSLYSYKLSTVHKYDVGAILEDVSISGFKYSTTGTPQYRYVIHLGAEFNNDPDLCLLWTERDFNYLVFDENSIIVTLCRKPKWKFYRYYLVRFVDKSDLDKWLADFGQLSSDHIPRVPENVQDFFLDSVVGKA